MPEIMEVKIFYLSVITSRLKRPFHAVEWFAVLLVKNEFTAVYVTQGKLFKLYPESAINRYLSPLSVFSGMK